MKHFYFFTVMVFLVTLAACATGKAFSRLDSEQLSPGVDTRGTIAQQLGNPSDPATVQIINGEPIETLVYSYSKSPVLAVGELGDDS